MYCAFWIKHQRVIVVAAAAAVTTHNNICVAQSVVGDNAWFGYERDYFFTNQNYYISTIVRWAEKQRVKQDKNPYMCSIGGITVFEDKECVPIDTD